MCSCFLKKKEKYALKRFVFFSSKRVKMNTFLCLAITFLLAGLMFMYVRNQMTALESKVSNLTEAVRALAEPTKEPILLEPQLKRCYVSDDSESEDESDEETEAPKVEEPKVEEPKVEEVQPTIEGLEDLRELADPQVHVRVIPMNMASMMQMLNAPVEFTKMQNSVTLDLDISESLDPLEVEDVKIEDATKPNYDAMNVKELKELATSKGAPASLKTKKALIEFLQA